MMETLSTLQGRASLHGCCCFLPGARAPLRPHVQRANGLGTELASSGDSVGFSGSQCVVESCPAGLCEWKVNLHSATMETGKDRTQPLSPSSKNSLLIPPNKLQKSIAICCHHSLYVQKECRILKIKKNLHCPEQNCQGPAPATTRTWVVHRSP